MNGIANSQKPENYVRCLAAGTAYALPMRQVRSIERSTRLEEAAGPSSLVGWLVTANERIPVYGLAQRAGRRQTAVLPGQRIVVLHHPEQAWGLLVDSVSQLVAVRATQLLPLPESLQNGRSHFFTGILQAAAGSALVLNTSQLHPDAVPPQAPAPARQPAASKPLLPAAAGERHIIIFSLPELPQNGRLLSFGVSIKQVAEIVDPLEVLPLQGESLYVQGVVQWRGQSVPLLRLVAEPAEEEKNGRERLLILRASETGELAALRVRSSIRTVELPVPHRPSARELPLDPILVSGCVELARETLVIPNIQAALAQPLLAAA